MKSSPSSVSSSSSTEPSFSLQNTEASATGCLSRFLNRFLCGVPSRSCNEIKGGSDGEVASSINQVETEGKQISGPAPSIVARLMGLDTMPANLRLDQQQPIGRSRSVNSMNDWIKLDPVRRIHRRIRASSFSFRESPTFMLEESEEYFTLTCFDSGREEKREKAVEATSPGPKQTKKPDPDFGKLKEKQGKISEMEAKMERRKVSMRKMTLEKRIKGRISRKSDSTETKNPKSPRKGEIYPETHSTSPAVNDIAHIMRLTKRGEKTEPSGCNSENSSSPVSVLFSPFDACNDFPDDPKPQISPDCVSTRKKLCVGFPPKQEKNLAVGEERGRSDSWREIWVVAGEEVKGLRWVASPGMSRWEGFEEISDGFAVQILDFLLHDAIVELMLLFEFAARRTERICV